MGGRYLFIYIRKDRFPLPITVSTVGALHMPVWLLDLFVKRLKRTQSLEKSVQYNRDQWLGRSFWRPYKLCKKKKNNTKPLLFIPFWFDSLSRLSFQRARGSSTTTKGSFTAFFGISYGRIRCLTFQQYVKKRIKRSIFLTMFGSAWSPYFFFALTVVWGVL